MTLQSISIRNHDVNKDTPEKIAPSKQSTNLIQKVAPLQAGGAEIVLLGGKKLHLKSDRQLEPKDFALLKSFCDEKNPVSKDRAYIAASIKKISEQYAQPLTKTEVKPKVEVLKPVEKIPSPIAVEKVIAPVEPNQTDQPIKKTWFGPAERKIAALIAVGLSIFSTTDERADGHLFGDLRGLTLQKTSLKTPKIASPIPAETANEFINADIASKSLAAPETLSISPQQESAYNATLASLPIKFPHTPLYQAILEQEVTIVANVTTYGGKNDYGVTKTERGSISGDLLRAKKTDEIAYAAVPLPEQLKHWGLPDLEGLLGVKKETWKGERTASTNQKLTEFVMLITRIDENGNIYTVIAEPDDRGPNLRFLKKGRPRIDFSRKVCASLGIDLKTNNPNSANHRHKLTIRFLKRGSEAHLAAQAKLQEQHSIAAKD